MNGFPSSITMWISAVLCMTEAIASICFREQKSCTTEEVEELVACLIMG